MVDAIDTILIVVVSGSLGIIGTYLSAVMKFRKDLQTKYDIDLRELRIKAYKDLWALTGKLSYYAQTEIITYGTIQELTVNLQKWYYENGGMFLSKTSMEIYLDIQKLIKKSLEDRNEEGTETFDGTIGKIRDKCSRLRTSLSVDVGTRRESELKNKKKLNSPKSDTKKDHD